MDKDKEIETPTHYNHIHIGLLEPMNPLPSIPELNGFKPTTPNRNYEGLSPSESSNSQLHIEEGGKLVSQNKKSKWYFWGHTKETGEFVTRIYDSDAGQNVTIDLPLGDYNMSLISIDGMSCSVRRHSVTNAVLEQRVLVVEAGSIPDSIHAAVFCDGIPNCSVSFTTQAPSFLDYHVNINFGGNSYVFSDFIHGLSVPFTPHGGVCVDKYHKKATMIYTYSTHTDNKNILETGTNHEFTFTYSDDSCN